MCMVLSFGLMPHLNVIDNIAFPLKLQVFSRRNVTSRRVIDLAVSTVGTNFPNELQVDNNSVLVLLAHLPSNLISGYLMNFFCSGPIDPEKYAMNFLTFSPNSISLLFSSHMIFKKRYGWQTGWLLYGME